MDIVINGELANVIAVLNEFDGVPIVFVSETESKGLYLCLCSETRGLTRWVAHKTSKNTLDDLIIGRITINDALMSCNDVTIIIERDTNGGYTYTNVNKDEVNPLFLTEQGLNLDWVNIDGLVNLVDYFAKGRSMNDEERKYFYEDMFKLYEITDEVIDL